MPSQPFDSMRPFSHTFGEICLIPGSCSALQAYPTRMRITSLEAMHREMIFSIKLTGPFKGFTVMQDLEKKFVRVYETAKEGFFLLLYDLKKTP